MNGGLIVSEHHDHHDGKCGSRSLWHCAGALVRILHSDLQIGAR